MRLRGMLFFQVCMLIILGNIHIYVCYLIIKFLDIMMIILLFSFYTVNGSCVCFL
jgi:hypothetical protein